MPVLKYSVIYLVTEVILSPAASRSWRCAPESCKNSQEIVLLQTAKNGRIHLVKFPVRLSFPPSGCGSKPMISHFGVGAPPILVYFSGDWDVHWGYGLLTHSQVVWSRIHGLVGVVSQFSTKTRVQIPPTQTHQSRLATSTWPNVSCQWLSNRLSSKLLVAAVLDWQPSR